MTRLLFISMLLLVLAVPVCFGAVDVISPENVTYSTSEVSLTYTAAGDHTFCNIFLDGNDISTSMGLFWAYSSYYWCEDITDELLPESNLTEGAHTLEVRAGSGVNDMVSFSVEFVVIPPSEVAWEASTLELGSTYIGADALTGSENVLSTESNTDVTVECASGNCSVITENWVDTTNMTDTQSLGVGFTCSDSVAGTYSAVFDVTSLEDATVNSINVSCEILQQSVEWEASTLDLGSGYLEEGTRIGSKSILSTGPNSGVTVTCASGDCLEITDDWADTTDMADVQSSGVEFTCSDSAIGTFSAVFDVTSAEDATVNSINVSCEIVQKVSWEASTLNLGSVYVGGGALNGSENITSNGSSTDVAVTCASGDCAEITDDWDNANDMNDAQSSGVGFTCSDAAVGSYSAVFDVTSVQDTTPDQIEVSCEITELSVAWETSSLYLSGYRDEGVLIGSENVISNGPNTDVTVVCDSGDCAVITEDWNDTIGMLDSESLAAVFTCDDSIAGVYSAIFNVTSVEDETSDHIKVSCEINIRYKVDWEAPTLDLSGYVGAGVTGSNNLISNGDNLVSVSCISGNCTEITEDWMDKTEMEDRQSLPVNFTCNDSSVGTYSAVFEVTSVMAVKETTLSQVFMGASLAEEIIWDEVNVTCSVTIQPDDDEGSGAEDYECFTSSDCGSCELCRSHECVVPDGSCQKDGDCGGDDDEFYSCEECSCIAYECRKDSDCDDNYECDDGECVEIEAIEEVPRTENLLSVPSGEDEGNNNGTTTLE